MRKRTFSLVIGALLLAAAGCAVGITPPDPTKMVQVEGGTFRFGETQVCFNNDSNNCNDSQPWPGVTVKVKTFYIDQHEVTNFQYEYCVAKGKCPKQDTFGTGGNTSEPTIFPYYEDKKYRQFPMVNVTFDMAKAYCAFVGRRLLTEVEWEYVVNQANKNDMMSDDRPRYVWGANASTCQGDDWVVAFCNSNVREPRQVATTAKDQITLGNGSVVYDMIGNVSEWVSDDYLKSITCKKELSFDKSNLASSQCPDYFSCAAKNPPDFDCLARSISCSDQCLDNGVDICYRAKGTSCCPFQDKPDDCRAICVPYLSTEIIEAGTSTSFRPGTANAGLYKGASYATGTKCELRFTTRGTISKVDNQRRKDLGFRCASDTAP